MTVQVAPGRPVPPTAVLLTAVRGAGFEGTALGGGSSGKAEEGGDQDSDSDDLLGLLEGAAVRPGGRSAAQCSSTVLVVPGMMCMRNCGTKVTAALKSVPGVQGACVCARLHGCMAA